MNSQRSFIHTLIVPFLIAMWILSLYLVYKKNPEMMNQESLHSVLAGPQKQSEIRTLSNEIREDLFTDLKITKPSRVSHRYVQIKDDLFKNIELGSNEIHWSATDDFIIVKEPTKITVSQSNGETLWSFTLPDENIFTPGPAPHIGAALYLSTTNGHVYAFDLQTGRIVWYLQSTFQLFRASLVTNTELLLFAEEKLNQSWALIVLDAHTGELKNTFPKLDLPLAGKPIESNNFVFYATQNGQLSALDLETGKLAWSTEASSSFRSGPAVIGERVYLTNEDGLALGFDRKTGRKINEVELGSSIQEPLQVISGTNIAITIDSNGYMIASDLKLSKRLWRYNLNMQKSRHPFELYKLSSKTLTQLNFASELQGWSIWTACNSTRICIFDAKEGRLLHRIDLKAEPVAQLEFVGAEANLLVPVKSGTGAKIIGFQIPTESNPPVDKSDLAP